MTKNTRTGGIAAMIAPADISCHEIFLRRLGALAHAHSLLTQNEWRGARLSALVEGELKPYGKRASFAGPDLVLAPRAALIVGLILHELATNAAKHGALAAREGRVEVTWSNHGESFRLTWSENGGPVVSTPARRGFGSSLLERAPAYEAAGTRTWNSPPRASATNSTPRFRS